MRLNHWRYLVLALISLLALAAFAACGDDDEGGGGDDTPAPATDEPATGERIQGGDLVIQSVEPESLDPHYSSFQQDITINRMLWRGLYTLDIDNVPQPSMADGEPDISADGLTYTITLKDGLLWSDGDDLTAEDFVAAFHRTCNPTNAGKYEFVLLNVVGCDDYYTALGTEEEPKTPTPEELETLRAAIGVQAIDDTTLEIQLSNAQPTFIIILALWPTFPSPSHLITTADQPWPAGASAPDQLAYNGPYILTEYVTQDHVTLAPNPNWAAPADVSPTLDTITIRFIDLLDQAARAYENDELSFTDVDLTQLERLKSTYVEGEEFFQEPAPDTRGLHMNLLRPPLDDINVRLALSKAIDREQINIVAVQGAYKPTTSWIPVVDGGVEPDSFEAEIGFDAEAAKQLLADAGFPGGEGFPTLNIMVRQGPQSEAQGQFLQESFRTILGIETTIDVADGPTRSGRFNSKDFDLAPGGWSHDYPDPENWVIGLYNTDGSSNNWSCSDPEIDALYDKALFNTNDEERRQQWVEVNELISTRICGIAPYWHEANNYLIKPNVVGMSENISGQDGAVAADWAAEYWGLSE